LRVFGQLGGNGYNRDRMVAVGRVQTETEGTAEDRGDVRRAGTRTRDEVEAVPFATTAYDPDRPPVPPGASLRDSLIGLRIDHFEIRALLGEGGMGTVYLAHDVSLDRPVAIKVLRRELGDKPELCERLILEAQAQARLQHPNVVNVYYIGTHAGAPYFAMEYVRGETLAERLQRHGPLGWEEALEYMIETTQALLDAHQRGIIHRDVKPSNLLVAGPHVKVADFGLAAETGRRQEHMVGSPSYAAPEQLAGKAPDHRSDIYSLGVTFHELLSGNLPFEADSLGELVHLHESAPRPAISAQRAPWKLRRLITEMMDPRPTERPWTYEELLGRLQALRPRELVPGGVAARAMALAVDAGLGAAVGLVLAPLVGGRGAVALGLAAWAGHYLVGHRVWGKTLGKRLFRLRIQGSTRAVNGLGLALRFALTLWGPLAAVGLTAARVGVTGLPETLVGGARALLGRQPLEVVLGDAVPQVILLGLWALGLLFAAVDEKRRALHDLLGRTRVIYALRGDSPASRRTP
jgi:hypothetical protein